MADNGARERSHSISDADESSDTDESILSLESLPSDDVIFEKSCEQTVGWFFNCTFHFFCFLSGQLMLDCKKYGNSSFRQMIKICVAVLVAPLILLFFVLNVGSLVFDFYAVIWCPFPNCGFIAGPYFGFKPFQNINTSNGTKAYNDPYSDTSYQHINFEDTVVTIATVSGSLSYLIMIYVLVVNYSTVHQFFKWLHTEFIVLLIRAFNFENINERDYRQEQNKVLMIHPFLNGKMMHEDLEFTPVYLYAKQLFCFYFFFSLNLLLYAANVIVLFVIVNKEMDNNYPKFELIDYFGLAAQLASRYCAIISCFIFSKVAYAVTIKCHEKLKEYKETVPDVVPENFDTTGALRDLERKDTEYVELCNRSMKPYRFWFSVHWFLYAVTGFMSIAYFIETVIITNGHRYLSIIYVFLFTLEHLVLFLYPCFRAASILEARNTLIHKVSLQSWPTAVKSPFIQFMKEQKCGFIMSLVCIRVEFGFNIAYISIFIGFLGIILKFFSLTTTT